MATMKEVAKLAGVSLGTVSRYINNAKGIKPQTKLAVEKAIKQLHYMPNEYAKGLKVNVTQTVVLLIPSIWNPFFSEFAYYVEQNLFKYNYKMILCDSGQDTKKELRYIKMVQQNKVDGIIGITYNNIDDYISNKLPFVSIDRYFDEKTSYVTSQNYEGGQLAAQTLLEKGATKLAYIGDYNDYPNDTLNRRIGFMAYLKMQDQPYHEIFEKEPLTHLEHELENLLKEGVDGIFCVTDSLALRVEKILTNQGVKIPEEVQLIGYDGINLTVDQAVHVSTIMQPIAQMAQKAVEIVMQKIADRDHDPVVARCPVTYRQGTTTR